ncbi:MAG: LysM peptidoglycan-binding domain-containing protein [Chloroflexi bacterium]|nr:LysM peptidoglycan-binding domain-containing protein [Chloroflexota bacterium]
MGYWGWRPLVFGLFISTWVVGCNLVTDNNIPSAAPSVYPRVTLTVGRLPTAQVSAAPTRAAPPTRIATTPSNETASPAPADYVVQPGDTFADIAARFDLSVEALQNANGGVVTLVPGQTLVIPTPLQLLIQPPTCYETRPGNLLCLGRIDNPFSFPVEQVALDVRLLQADGSVFQSARSTVAQTAILAGSFAPYQATFAASEKDFVAAEADLVTAEIGAPDRFVMLLIEDVQGQTSAGRTIVSAVIDNPGPQNAELLRAFVTLLDNLGRVIGYRVVTFDSGTILNAGAQMPFDLEVTPQLGGVTLDYLLYIEARPIEN